MRVAYQGEPGAFSEEAAQQFFDAQGQAVVYHPCASFHETFKALDSNLVDRTALPIENSLAGTIHENLDLLLRYPNITIVGELDLKVRHCLLALKGTKFSDVKVVQSHPMALAQCTGYLQRNGLKSEVAYDTAGSAKLISKEKNSNAAAIAGKRAAEIYDLDILEEGIQDEKVNFTRFLILSREQSVYKPDTPSKTSLVFALMNGPGILYRALSVFAVTNIDLTKIESRHIHSVREALRLSEEEFERDDVESRWEYVFFVDIARHAEEKAVRSALNHLQEITTFYRVLGAYPQHVHDGHD